MMEPNASAYLCARDATLEWIEDTASEVAGWVLFPGDEIPEATVARSYLTPSGPRKAPNCAVRASPQLSEPAG